MWYFRARRLALRPASGERIEVERILAAARAALAVSSFLALLLTSAPDFQYDNLVHVLLLLYSGHALALLVLLHTRSAVSSRFTRVVHVIDVLWPAVISLCTNGRAGPLFLFFIFAPLAAAFRWGMREAILTMLAAIATILGEAIALTYPPMVTNIVWEVPLDTLLLRIVYLVTFSLLFGYLAESEKRRHAEALSISHISAMARVDATWRVSRSSRRQEKWSSLGGDWRISRPTPVLSRCRNGVREQAGRKTTEQALRSSTVKVSSFAVQDVISPPPSLGIILSNDCSRAWCRSLPTLSDACSCLSRGLGAVRSRSCVSCNNLRLA